MKIKKEITIGVIVIAVLLVIGTVIAYATAKNPQPYETLNTNFADNEVDPAKFGKLFPVEYNYYLKNKEMALAPSKYKGSIPRDHLKEFPYMKTLWAGFSFSMEYNENRGHIYALEDIKKTKRVDQKTPLTCMTCKSPQVPIYMKKWGEDNFFKKNFRQNQNLFTIPISCYDCHDPKTMKLRITRPALIEALKRQGKDVTKLTKTELRNYVCAQCHVTYYLQGTTKKLFFPWDDGIEPSEMYKYYEKRNFSEWVNPISGTHELKARHPDYEMFLGGPHSDAGLTCADCHMPYIYENGKKHSSHWWTSPLRTIEQSCQQCHNATPDQLKQRVFYIQDRTYDLLNRAGYANEDAIKTIGDAVYKPGADKSLLEAARKLQREAQWYWDFVSAENSVGFHNPAKAMSTLGQSIDLARQAKEKAIQAVSKSVY